MWKRIYVKNVGTNYEVNEHGKVRNRTSKFILKPQKNRNGYLEAHIYFNHKNHPLLINRLVAIAFIPNPENKPEVNHIDGNKLNNDISNLEWNTREENMQHSWKYGLRHKMLGKNNPSTKSSEKIVHKICKYLEKDYPPSKIASKLNVSVDLVKSIKYKGSWNWISDNYNIPDSFHPDYSLSKYHKIIDQLLMDGFTGRKIRKILPLDIPKSKYKNLLANRTKALKKKGKLKRSTTRNEILAIKFLK